MEKKKKKCIFYVFWPECVFAYDSFQLSSFIRLGVVMTTLGRRVHRSKLVVLLFVLTISFLAAIAVASVDDAFAVDAEDATLLFLMTSLFNYVAVARALCA